MTRISFRASGVGVRPAGLALGALAAFACLGAGPAVAQDAKDKYVFFSDAKENPKSLARELKVRPNVDQDFYLYLRNPRPDPKEVTVEVVVDENTKFTKEKVTLPAKKKDKDEPVKVTFGKPEPVKEGAAPPPLPVLKGAKPQFKVVVKDETGVLESYDVPVVVLRAEDYLDDPKLRFVAAAGGQPNRVEVQVKAKDGFSGPPCEVELVLSPENIPGLNPDFEGANRAGAINGRGEGVKLYAEGITFEGNKVPERAVVALKVDGVPRAFTFKTSFALAGGAAVSNKETTPALRLGGPAFAKPGDKYVVRLEADNLPDDDLPLQLGSVTGNVVKEDKLFDSVQSRQVRFTAKGPDESLRLRADVADWTYDLLADRTKGMKGPQVLRVWVPGKQYVAEKTIIFDGTPPENVAIVRMEPSKTRDKLMVTATAVEKESRIDKVTFYVGKLENNELPKNEEGVPGKLKDGVWTAILDWPSGAEKADVNVQFVNAVGLKTKFKTANFTMPKEGDGPTVLKVTALDIAGKPQGKGSDVVLTISKDKKVVMTLTKDRIPKGVTVTEDKEWVIEGLDPGKYTVVATKKLATKTIKSEEVEVTLEKGKPVEEKIQMK